ncbi:D-alanyl-D-alanine carboxypeptidase family protein [Pseudorhodoplanes sp.]|uniref:D-alanyl-D-alanine carboxypeptidase family protein n=1 Tax=Pseudorhodoplanes sp. TaxID=1934341 RepID=UPI002C6557C2|nr:D-alanyl-D-alanine carboxypeptidase family protein [Pseudorhodoplanes sp.]
MTQLTPRALGALAALSILAASLGAAFSAPATIAGGKAKEDGFQTAAPNAILIEAESGTVLFEKNADALVAPASLAKLMTAETVFNEIKEGNVKLDEEFVVSERAWRKGGAPSGGSTMFAPIHSRVKVSDLLQGAIIQSGNDACITLAEGIAGNEEAFVRLMNGRARELGLTQSNFTNSTGLPDPEQRVTTRELAKLARHIIHTYPDFYKWYGEKEFTFNKIRQLNRNPLLAMNIGADGLKTGFTNESGYGLVGSAVQNNMRLIVVVNGLKTATERADEARKILNFGFNGFESRVLFAEGQRIGEARAYGGEQRYVPLEALGRKPIRLMVPKNGTERIIARIVYQGPLDVPVKEGQEVGVLKVWRGDNVALEVPLQAAESVPAGPLHRRAMDGLAELFGGWFRAGLQKL